MIKIDTFDIKGMHCASCATIIERTVKKFDGIKEVSVNNAAEKIKIKFDETKVTPQQLNQKLDPLGYSIINVSPGIENDISQSKKEKQTEIHNMKKRVYSALPLVAISIFVMVWDVLGNYNLDLMMPKLISDFFHHLMPIIATYIFITLGKPYLLGVYRFFRYGKANMDTLIGLGTSVAFIYSFITSVLGFKENFYDVVIVVITFVALGKFLEAKSKLKTGDAIEKLIGLQPKNALVLRDGIEIEVNIKDVKHGEVLIVKPGQKIPLDGVVIEGSSYVDESMITGEPIPVEKNINANVVAGTLNTTGTFNLKVTKIGSETLLSHIIKMVEDAQGSKAPIQALVDKISAVFVPIVLGLAVLAFALWMYFGVPILGFSTALSFALTTFVGILVIACPCALGLATPTAIIVGVGKGAKEGILIKDAATLETLYKSDVIVMDKTGTITIGRPELTDVKVLSDGVDEKMIVSILASLENKSEHPIATAILDYAKSNKFEIKSTSKFEIMKGKGLKGVVDGVEYYAGNLKIASDLNIDFDEKSVVEESKRGKTPVLVANKDSILGIVYVSDQVKKEAIETIKVLHELKKRVVMLTGDNKNTAEYISKIVGIDEVKAELMPEDKLNIIKDFQKDGKIVVMVGDGVNDSPALALANVGIAMGTGSDVAIESSGMTLLGGDISKIAKAIKLSKMTMNGIKQNLFFAFVYNVIGIPLAGGLLYPFFGLMLSPIFAGFAMAMSSVSVVSNSLRIKALKL